MRQRWSALLFLHWPVNAEKIAALLPDGLHVDTYDGRAWLGVVPFFMERVRPVGLPPMPWLSWFLELNVRTYVFDDRGNPGVWFFSLDCNQPLAVEFARRIFHLPYEHAEMSAATTGTHVKYRSKRKVERANFATFDYHTPVATQAAALDSLEWFLVERYLLFSADPQGGLHCGRVHHRPYQIAAAQCDEWSVELLRHHDLPVPEVRPVSMLTAAPLDVDIFALRRCGGNA